MITINIPGRAGSSVLQSDWQGVIDLMIAAEHLTQEANKFGKNNKLEKSAKVMEAYFITICKLSKLSSLDKRDNDKTAIRKLLIANKVTASKAKRLIETSSNFITRFGPDNVPLLDVAKAGDIKALQETFDAMQINTEAKLVRFVDGKDEESFEQKAVKPLLKADEKGEKAEVKEALAAIIGWAQSNGYDVESLILEASE
jgi:hypothetical protein